ncbi:MAG: TetR/AcrR family transcriptional regulator [Chloroflexales bacterium]|nr:TetR/AcrR family transcriptional regulator [Chloroflexales bacterium]
MDSILEAAIQVFEQYGYAAGTTARIAERAGVAVGSLYQYFPNKDAILVALAEQHIAECHTLATQAFAQTREMTLSLAETLRLVVKGFIDLHAANPQVHRLLSEEVVPPLEVQQAQMAVERMLVEEVQQILASYSAVDASRRSLVAYVIVQVAEHLTHQLVLHPPHKLTPEACVDEVVQVLLGYIQQQSIGCDATRMVSGTQ